MYKKILIATDGTQYSASAIIEATDMARRYGGAITLLHIIKDILAPDPFGHTSPYIEQIIEKSAKNFMEVFKGMAIEDGVVNVETVVRRGEEFHRAIVGEAMKKNADLIMLGRRRTSIMSRLFFGSLSSQILKRTSCDVLIVPWASLIQWNTILVAIEAGHYKEAVAQRAFSLAREGKSSLIGLIVYSTESQRKAAQDIEQGLARTAAKEGMAIEVHQEKGDSVEPVTKLTAQKNVDVVVTASPALGGSFKESLLGSFAERIIDRSLCAVLVARS